MARHIAIVGAGVSGLTCGVILAERGYRVAIFAEETGQHTTSAAAAAIWYPYDAEPAEKVIAWALETYKILVDLSRDKRSGVSMIELRTFSRTGQIQIPEWAIPLGAQQLSPSVIPTEVEESLTIFHSGFSIDVPMMDTTIYLDYLTNRFVAAVGQINSNVRLAKLEDISRDFDFVVNCAGIGARTLINDSDLEPHRGQVVIVPKMDISCAIVCDDAPLMYAIPRANDCVFGGTNEVSNDRNADPAATSRILAECSRVLNIDEPKVLTERVGLRPFRRSGVRLCADRLRDGRRVIHNYGHGGAGFTLSWGCAQEVLQLGNR
jgi:D-amino-acid oxidase